MKSEPDPSHTSVRPRAVALTPFAQTVGPRHAGTPAASLTRQDLLHHLWGPDELLVLHSGRFDLARGLLRSWLTAAVTASAADTSTALACAPASGTDTGTEVCPDEYWTRLHDELHACHAPPTCTANCGDPFATVLGCVSAQTVPVVLGLDDLHLIPESVDRVEELLRDGAPHGLRIIVGTRSDTGWSGPLTREPGRRLIAPSSMRIRSKDVARYLTDRGLDHDVRSPEIICRLTGGMPALATKVCNSVPAEELLRPRHLDEHIPTIIDRKVDQAISDDPQLTGRRRVLVLSAAADPLTRESAARAPSGDVLLGLLGLLETLEQTGLAQVSGDPAAPRWVYPEVVRESLLRLAERDHPAELEQYRAALIEHWLTVDAPHDALRVAAAAGDWPQVVEIIRAHSETLYTRDYPVTMHDQVLARAPEHLVAEDPFLRRLRELHHRFDSPGRGGTASAVPAYDDEDDDGGVGEIVDGGAGVGEIVDDDVHELMITAITLRLEGRYEESAQLCDRALPTVANVPTPTTDEGRDLAAFGLVQIGVSYILAGRFGPAISALLRSFRLGVEPFIHRDAAGKLALVHALFGDTEEASSWLEEERRHPALPSGTEALVRPAGDVAAALLALDRLDSATAVSVLDDLGPPADREEFWGFILYARAAAALVDGNAASALRFLEKDLLRFTPVEDGGGVADPLLDAVRADLHLACDRAPAAFELLSGSPHSSHPLTVSARARAHLLSDDPSTALSLARANRSTPSTAMRHAQELDLVAAAASLALGDTADARAFLDSALATYRFTHSLRPFRTLPSQVMLRLAALAELPVTVPDPGPEFGTLSFPRAGPGVPASGAPPEPRPLTDREHAILRALATGATTRQIAEQEFVSVNTVKTQISAVYRKLSVSTRDSAAAAARALGLL